MSAETQIRALAQHIQPLANVLSDYRPQSSRIHVHRADFEALKAHPDLAQMNGFTIHQDGVIAFKHFTLVPTDCGARHGKRKKG